MKDNGREHFTTQVIYRINSPIKILLRIVVQIKKYVINVLYDFIKSCNASFLTFESVHRNTFVGCSGRLLSVEGGPSVKNQPQVHEE